MLEQIAFSQGHSTVGATTNPNLPSTCLVQSLECFVALV